MRGQKPDALPLNDAERVEWELLIRRHSTLSTGSWDKFIPPSARTRIRAKCYHSEALFSIPHQNPVRKIRIAGLLTDFWGCRWSQPW